MKILACDTSCDETSVAVIEDGRILSNKLSSQIQHHQEWGGVVPSLARRKHEELLPLVIEQALHAAKCTLKDIDVFAVTVGPGLAIALEVGISTFKDLSKQYKKPLIGVNHMEGHLYSTLAMNSHGLPQRSLSFPALVVLISGGHTEFILMENHGKYRIMGQTLDDAIGEAFDKVGRMLDLGYPAGPVIEQLATLGDEKAYQLPIPMKHSGNADMSYSGLKTAAMKLVNDELKSPLNKYGEKFKDSLQKSNKRNQNTETHDVKSGTMSSAQITYNIAASFQKAATDQLLHKLQFLLGKLTRDGYTIQNILVGGGVAQNQYIRRQIRAVIGKSYTIYFPVNKKLHTDNAGMIGIAAYYNALRNNFISDIDSLDRKPNWRIDAV